MNNHSDIDKRTRWGYVNFSQKHIPAMAVAIPIGLLLGAGLAAIIHATHFFHGPHAVEANIAFSLFATFNFIAMIWIIVVDRSTMRGAVDNPQESVEKHWYTQACSGTLHDLLIIAGITGAALVITDTAFDAGIALLALPVFAALDVLTRYFVGKRRG